MRHCKGVWADMQLGERLLCLQKHALPCSHLKAGEGSLKLILQNPAGHVGKTETS